MTQVGDLKDNDYDITTNPITISNAEIESKMNFNIYGEVSGDVENILNEEETRLGIKEGEIDKLYETHNRNKHFKNSAAKRNNAYWRMFMVLLLLAIIAVSLYMFRTNFPFVPSWAMDLVLIAVVAGGFIYMFTMYENIMKRDLTDFDKLDPYSPVMLRDKKIEEAKELADKGKITASIVAEEAPEDCQGEKCCTTGSYFENGKCVVSTTESFTPFKKSLGFSTL